MLVDLVQLRHIQWSRMRLNQPEWMEFKFLENKIYLQQNFPFFLKKKTPQMLYLMKFWTYKSHAEL